MYFVVVFFPPRKMTHEAKPTTLKVDMVHCPKDLETDLLDRAPRGRRRSIAAEPSSGGQNGTREKPGCGTDTPDISTTPNTKPMGNLPISFCPAKPPIHLGQGTF